MLHRRILLSVGGSAAILLAAGGTMAAVTIETVPVGDPGNAADTRYGGVSFGAVSYGYNIGKYEVTAGQYCKFLNAVAKTDTYGLYNPLMNSQSKGCQITQTGDSGSFAYDFSGGPGGRAVDWVDRPVNYVSWGDAARFANWLHNGQPTGAQNLSTTEDGAYYLNGATSEAALMAVTRKADATWVIPSEDEWYKAAYYKGGSTNAGYWDYPTSSNTRPGQEIDDCYFTGNNANYSLQWLNFVIGDPYYRTPGGAFHPSDSPCGTFDQAGNVWEWNEGIMYGTIRGLRGASFDDDEAYLYADYMHAKERIYANPSDEYEYCSFGFRVSEVPEPATMAALALGSVGMLLRRRGLRR